MQHPRTFGVSLTLINLLHRPGGLVTLKTLLESSTPERPIEACLFEVYVSWPPLPSSNWRHLYGLSANGNIHVYREGDIGGTFNYRSYENAELVSSKQLTAFSDHRFPLDTTDHVSLPKYVDYLKSYVARFHLDRYIKLNSPVTDVSPLGGDQKWKHRVKYVDRSSAREEHVFDCSHVAICTGLHVQPEIPSIPGIENVQGEVFHSSLYKDRSQVAGRNVLILGCGETAMGEPSCLCHPAASGLIRTRRHRIRVDQSGRKIGHYVFSYGLSLISETAQSLSSVWQDLQRRPANRQPDHQSLRNGIRAPCGCQKQTTLVRIGFRH